MAIDDLHDDEIKARLGIELGEDMEHRIEAHMVRAMPEEFDPDTEIDLSLLDLTTTTTTTTLPPLCSCTASRYDGDDGWDRMCPIHGVEAGD